MAIAAKFLQLSGRVDGVIRFRRDGSVSPSRGVTSGGGWRSIAVRVVDETTGRERVFFGPAEGIAQDAANDPRKLRP